MKSLKYVMLFLYILSTSACSKVIGYGVVNWSIPEYNLIAGDVLPILVKSNVSKSYIVHLDTENQEKEIPLWQLTFFKTKKEVEQFRTKIAENAFMYAQVLQDGLPMRIQPENTSKQVYRLRENQIVKILWKGDGVPVLRNGEPLPGDWYMIMTDDGADGWCFSLNLRIYDEREEETIVEETEIDNDNLLNDILAKQWYPESYSKMIAINRIDLERILPDYGFFPGLKNKVARLKVQETDLSFPYRRISKGEANVYNFEGSNLSIQVRSANRIAVQFTDAKGMPDVEYFVTIDSSLESIIETENERRNKLITALSDAGRTFHSASYGTLTIEPTGSFTWTGYKALSGKIIPSKAQEHGTIKIRFFPSPTLSSQYETVLSFYFENLDDSIDFLACRINDGLQLEYVNKTNISESVVQKRNAQPTVLFFGK